MSVVSVSLEEDMVSVMSYLGCRYEEGGGRQDLVCQECVMTERSRCLLHSGLDKMHGVPSAVKAKYS